MPQTLVSLLHARLARSPEAVGLLEKSPSGQWEGTTWKAFAERATRVAHALTRHGVRPGARVGIIASNGIDWEVAQFGALMAGTCVVGLDEHYPDAQLNRLARACGLDALFVATRASCDRLEPDLISGLRQLICLREEAPAGLPNATSLASLETASMDQVLPDVKPDTPAIIVFSSGTTGEPKLVQYTHGQIMLAAEGIVGAFGEIPEQCALLCWLPLANLFQRMINYCAMERGACTHLLPDPRKVMDAVRETRPYLLIGVPRFFERVYRGVNERIDKGPMLARAIARWAIATGVRHRSDGRTGSLSLKLADHLVLRKLRAVFGGEVRFLVSGSAPVPAGLHEFYDAIGLPIHEAYGVSECVVPIAMNRPGQRRPGTVGRPLPQSEVKLSGEGEVLVRGTGVFGGYLGQAPGPGTAPDPEGYWHTGDLGVLEDGYLRLNGRKADVFKLSTGRWVSPALVEGALLGVPSLDHAVVVGAGRKAGVAIVACSGVPADEQGRRDFGRQLGEAVAQAAAGLPDYQRPAGLLVLDRPFSIGDGELTTNLKVRRKVIEAKLSARIESLYDQLDRTPPRAGEPSTLVVFA